jgi:HAMP domain-containing protein
MKFTITAKLITLVLILVFAQIFLIGILVFQAEKNLAKETETRLEIQSQQVDIQANDYRNLIDSMHVFTGNNIETNLEVARIQFIDQCGEYVTKVDDRLECPNGYVIDDAVSDNSLLVGIKNIVRGHSSIFVDLGDGEAKKISTTVKEGLYAYGYTAEKSLYEKVISGGESFLKYTKIEGVYKTKACDPLAQQDGSVVGALCVGVLEKDTVEQIKEGVSEYSFGNGGKVYVLDAYEDRLGGIVAHPEIPEGEQATDMPHIQTMLENESGTITFEENGVEQIAAYYAYEPYDWVVVAQHPIIAQESIGSEMIIIASLAVLVASLVGALVFSRTITKPINQLTAFANKLAMGEIDAQFPTIKTNDEVKDLASAMKKVLIAIENLIETAESMRKQTSKKK